MSDIVLGIQKLRRQAKDSALLKAASSIQVVRIYVRKPNIHNLEVKVILVSSLICGIFPHH